MGERRYLEVAGPIEGPGGSRGNARGGRQVEDFGSIDVGTMGAGGGDGSRWGTGERWGRWE